MLNSTPNQRDKQTGNVAIKAERVNHQRADNGSSNLTIQNQAISMDLDVDPSLEKPVPPENSGVYQNDQETITLPKILSVEDIKACVVEGDVASIKTHKAIMQLVWDYITELDSNCKFTNPVSSMQNWSILF